MCVHVHARVSNSVFLFGCLCVSVSGIVREKERKLLFWVFFFCIYVCSCLSGCLCAKERNWRQKKCGRMSERGRCSRACTNMSRRICHIRGESTRSLWCPDPAACWCYLAVATQQPPSLGLWACRSLTLCNPSGNLWSAQQLQLTPHILNSCLHPGGETSHWRVGMCVCAWKQENIIPPVKISNHFQLIALQVQ